MKKNAKQERRKKYVLAGAVLVSLFVLASGVISQAGYVLSGQYIVKGGTITLANTLAGSVVFIDDKQVGRIDAAGNGVFEGVKPGDRNVIVSHTDAWPWIFDFQSFPDGNTTLYPLQVAKDTNGTVLQDPADPIRRQAIVAFAKYGEPTRMQPLERVGTRVWVVGTAIFVQQNEEVRNIFSSPNPLRNVFWYGDRNDVIIVTMQNKVFALDLRKTEIQNFQPIYQGAAPEAVPNPTRSNIIFVRDAKQYFSIEI